MFTVLDEFICFLLHSTRPLSLSLFLSAIPIQPTKWRLYSPDMSRTSELCNDRDATVSMVTENYGTGPWSAWWVGLRGGGGEEGDTNRPLNIRESLYVRPVEFYCSLTIGGTRQDVVFSPTTLQSRHM